MPYKLIVCDLDETLLNSRHMVSEQNCAAILKARELGVKFVPATGRDFSSIRGTLATLKLLGKEQEYAITYNGGAVFENKGERLLYSKSLPFPLAEELFQRGLAYHVGIRVYTLNAVYAYRLSIEDRDFLKGRMAVQEFFTPDIWCFQGQQIVKILFSNTNLPYLRSIEKELKDISRHLEVSYSSNRYLEFNPKGVNKGVGLLYLSDLMGITPEETIAIGDNFNDLPMIKAAGLGVGVSNTIDEMKPMCDVITRASCEESAIAELIEQYIFNNGT